MPEMVESYIKEYFSDDMLRKLYLIAMDNSYPHNNAKAETIIKLIGSDFDELGTGTNRTVVKRGKVVFKIALDRRGLIDNFTEFKRSPEVPMYCARSYESNLLITVSEYVNLMDEQDYLANRDSILEILKDLSKAYIFEDMGYSQINRCNTGYRDNGDIVFLDYGYMYPRAGNEDALICRHCGSPMKYNSTFTKFVCTHVDCQVENDFAAIRRRMRRDLENEEDSLIQGIMKMPFPDWRKPEVQKYMIDRNKL